MSYKYIPEWMQARSEASKRAWEGRWERMWELGEFQRLGPKGQEYISRTKGTEVYQDEELDYYDQESPFDFEWEY